MDQPFVMSLLFVLGLLLVGFVLRAGIKPLRLLFVPASVVGGLIGLAVMQGGLRIGEAEVIRGDDGLIVWDEDLWVGEIDEDGSTDVIPDHEVSGTAAGWIEPRLQQGQAAVASQYWAAEIANIIDSWPGLLIAVVFAGLLMERPGKKFKEAIVAASRQGIVVWIIVFGQAFVGLLAAALFIAPFYDIPPSFGQLIETGFAGGHGTAAAMGEVFTETQNFPIGQDLAFLFATGGLVYGVISGIFFVNLGVRRGWLRGGPRRVGPGPPSKPAPSTATASEPDGGPGPTLLGYAEAFPQPVERGGFKIPVVSGLEDRADPPPSAFAKVRAEVIDPFAFQLCIIGVAFFVGWLMQQGFLWAAEAGLPADWQKFVGKIPLFLFTLLGGWLTRELMHVIGFGDLIDGPSIHRITGVAMELLIVAALATLRIEAASKYMMPIIILLVVGFAWCAFCLLFVSRKLLPQSHWFELGLINYGMSTATTAQGVLLLRIVDRDLETDAASDYAAAAPLSAPFIGGGVITVLGLPLALTTLGYWIVLPAMAVVLAGLFVVGWMLRDR